MADFNELWSQLERKNPDLTKADEPISIKPCNLKRMCEQFYSQGQKSSNTKPAVDFLNSLWGGK